MLRADHRKQEQEGMDRHGETQLQSAFHHLTPETVINLVEKTLGQRCTNLCRPLISYINRVYELETGDGRGIIVKFYRPGRWSRAGLQDEHDFLNELAAREIPVVAPLTLRDGSSLGSSGSIHFAVFPKTGGRSFDEYSDEQWLELGAPAEGQAYHGPGHLDPEAGTVSPPEQLHSRRHGGPLSRSGRGFHQHSQSPVQLGGDDPHPRRLPFFQSHLPAGRVHLPH
jgi:hypothetical protein